MHLPRTTRAAVGLVAAAALFTGCGSDTTDDTASETSSEVSEPATDEASSLTITDPWVKAADEGEMTAAFGVLRNEGDTEVTVTSASSDVSEMMELHETVENDDGTMAMQPKQGGFTIAAGDSHELAPGGDHVMFMGLNRALKPGEDLTVTLTLDDGSTMEMTAPVKEFDGADENYQDGEDHEGMDMSDGSSE